MAHLKYRMYEFYQNSLDFSYLLNKSGGKREIKNAFHRQRKSGRKRVTATKKADIDIDRGQKLGNAAGLARSPVHLEKRKDGIRRRPCI
jgi:hypothetical protein